MVYSWQNFDIKKDARVSFPVKSVSWKIPEERVEISISKSRQFEA